MAQLKMLVLGYYPSNQLISEISEILILLCHSNNLTRDYCYY